MNTHNIDFYGEIKILSSEYEPRQEKTVFFAYAKTKTQISFAVTAKVISVFVFATPIVQSLYVLNPKFQASSHLLWLYRLVCVRPGRKPRRQVLSQRSSHNQICNVICSSVYLAPDSVKLEANKGDMSYFYKQEEVNIFHMSLILRKPVFGVSDQVQHKPGCTATEDG